MSAGRIHKSQGRKRLEGPRRSALKAPSLSTAVREQPWHASERSKRAVRSLSATLRARVARGVAAALSGHSTSQTGAQLEEQALALYRAGRRELRTDSPIALSHLVRWAVGTAVSQALVLAATDAGLDTDRGRALLDLATRLEGRAERASVAAITCAGLLAGPRAPDPADAHRRVLETFGHRPAPASNPEPDGGDE